jgi:predicted small secreted protein
MKEIRKMKIKMFRFAVMAIIGGLSLGGLLLSGCNTVHGVGKDIESTSGK